MCGRYVLRMQEKYLREWQIYGTPDFLQVSYNVSPTQSVPIVRWREGRREGTLVRWGLIPFFAKGEPTKYSTVNARIETLETAASYRGPWNRGQRCIQLATGFYEWHLDANGRKAPHFIHLVDQELFGFAGLWDASTKADGSVVESCVHVTIPGNDLMREVHNTGNNPYRMPAILRAEDRDVWLNGTPEEARAVLRPYPADLMVHYEVTTRVNTPKNNDETLIEPLRDPDQPGAV
jgi:putative SOS response-associated peptidase YedK